MKAGVVPPLLRGGRGCVSILLPLFCTVFQILCTPPLKRGDRALIRGKTNNGEAWCRPFQRKWDHLRRRIGQKTGKKDSLEKEMSGFCLHKQRNVERAVRGGIQEQLNPASG